MNNDELMNSVLLFFAAGLQIFIALHNFFFNSDYLKTYSHKLLVCLINFRLFHLFIYLPVEF